MKTQFIQFMVVFLILGWGMVGCTGAASQLPPTATPVPEATAIAAQPSPPEVPVMQATPATDPPAATVLAMVERLNAGDVEGSLAYFADNALGYIVGLPPTGMEVYTGKEQIRSLWEDSVNNHFQWEIEITRANGNNVYVRATTWHDFTRELGVAPLEWLDVYEVEEGQITTYSTTITEESLARFKSAFAEVMPPEAPAAPSSEIPVSEMMVTIAGGTCIYDGSMALQTGKVQVTLGVQDQDNELYALTLFTLAAGKDNLDLMASTAGAGPPSWADMILFEELGPGKNETYTFSVEEGPVYGVCWSQPPDLAIGVVGPFTVTP